MQPPETVEMQGKHSNLIRIFPGIYMDPEEFQSEKRPRQESQSLSKANVFTLPEDSQAFRGDDSGDTGQALSRLLETWPKLSSGQRSLLVETAKQFMTTDSLMDLN
ncbi:hypothetical protein N9B09_01365 [bacterium]|nr:hypothetical protein [bacterium]